MSSTIFFRNSKRSIPLYDSTSSDGLSSINPAVVNLPVASKVSIAFRWCLAPSMLSFLSCAGVIFKAPVPKSVVTYTSAIMGILRLMMGTITSLPTILLYRSSVGFTQMATSPKMVSGLVVATVMPPFPKVE